MKTLRSIKTNLAPAAIGPYSQGIITRDFIFVSGQLGIHPETGELISDAFEAQAHQSLENLKHIVREGGSGLHRVVSVDVFLTDMNYFQAFNEIYRTYFTKHQPARAVIEVSALPKGALIEIKCIARMENK